MKCIDCGRTPAAGVFFVVCNKCGAKFCNRCRGKNMKCTKCGSGIVS